MRPSAWFGALLTVTAACGGSGAPQAPNAPKSASGFEAERFFPLEDGRLYHYVTSEGGEPGMLVARVHRSDATHGELRISNATKRFVYGPSGVGYEGGATLLSTPVVEGASWPGEHGGTTTLTESNVSVTVPAGTYAGCVKTVEHAGRVPDATYATTYCPGVGMVLLEVRAGAGEARAALKSYGAPVDLR